MDCSDIIVAPATAVGVGAIAIIRVSGSRCMQLVQPFLSVPDKKLCSHKFYYSLFKYGDEVIDEIMVVYMASPRTFTGEDCVEIQCHNNRIIVNTIIDVLIQAGARVADPGEFTRRAFVNGRIDLSQAEAVADIIGAQSERAAKIAVDQLSGRLSQLVFGYRDTLVELLSLVEAYIDFPEDDFELPHFSQLKVRISDLLSEIGSLLYSFEEGRLVKDGLSVVIVGHPNVGKSSILNRILGTDRAIVTSVPGTTRDVIEETVVIDGLVLRFADTAGIRSTCDLVEKDGILRALDKLKCADLVLFVVDNVDEICLPDYLLVEDAPQFIVVVNKIDINGLPDVPDNIKTPVAYVSAKTGEGFDCLYSEISNIFLSGGDACSESFLLTDRRHRDALSRCKSSLDDFILDLDAGMSPEFLALHLRDALQSLGLITGETTPDHVLDSIFSKFCVGK